MVQLGICAFRQGMIKDAHNALLDIQSSGRAKELLGQGLLMRNMQERNAEQEKIEKRRQVRFHHRVRMDVSVVITRSRRRPSCIKCVMDFLSVIVIT